MGGHVLIRKGEYSKLKSENKIFMDGECIVSIVETAQDGIEKVPALVMKVGDGVTRYDSLPLLCAIPSTMKESLAYTDEEILKIVNDYIYPIRSMYDTTLSDGFIPTQTGVNEWFDLPDEAIGISKFILTNNGSSDVYVELGIRSGNENEIGDSWLFGNYPVGETVVSEQDIDENYGFSKGMFYAKSIGINTDSTDVSVKVEFYSKDKSGGSPNILDEAKTYTDNKVGDTSIKHEITVDVDVSDMVYELDFSTEPKYVSSVTIHEPGVDIDYPYHEQGRVVFYYVDKTSENVVAEHVEKPIVFNPNQEKLVEKIEVSNGICNYMFVEYTWFTKSNVTVTEYVDNAIQSAKEYSNEKAESAEKNAKAYSDEKAIVAEQNAKAYVDGEKTVVLPERLQYGVYRLPEDCVGLKSATVTWNETLTGSDNAYLLLYDDIMVEYPDPIGAVGSFEYFYRDGLKQEISFKGFENRSDVKYIYVYNDVGETGLVSFTYYTKTKAKEYTDISIQQAILDSWEVGV